MSNDNEQLALRVARRYQTEHLAKRFRVPNEWVQQALKNPHSGVGGSSFNEIRDKLIEAAKERGLNVTSVINFTTLKNRLEQYFSKTGTAVNKRFDAYIALAADNVSKLRNSDVFRVLSAAKGAKELTALIAYIKGKNPALSSTLDEDAKDVREEKGW